jgi:hypothetical protein
MISFYLRPETDMRLPSPMPSTSTHHNPPPLTHSTLPPKKKRKEKGKSRLG